MKKRERLLNWPNLISLSRLFFGIAVFIFLLKSMRVTAFFLFSIGALTDHWDGVIARKFNLSSKHGAMLDALFDRVLVLFALIGLFISGNLNNLLRLVFLIWVVAEVLFALIVLVKKRAFWLTCVHRDSIRFTAVFGFATVAWGIIGWDYIWILASITFVFMLFTLVDYSLWLSGRDWKAYGALRARLKKTKFREYLNGE